MGRYILRRGLLLIPIFFKISMVIFSLIHLVPGNPIDNLLGPDMTLEHQRKITEKYHLDKPLHIQYIILVRVIPEYKFTDEDILKR
jgi:ABC-type dipeptide/oligopeptide/nickel transport system permease component